MSPGLWKCGAGSPAKPQPFPLFLVKVINTRLGCSQEGHPAASRAGNGFLPSRSAVALYVFPRNYNMVLI